MIDGVELENANGEFCGGTFRDSFAHSCNSVFAPLGVKVGAERLVDAAERFGWNAPPTVPGEVPSTLPPAAEITHPARGRLDRDRPVQGRSPRRSRWPRWPRRSPRDGVRHEPTLAAGRPARAACA